MYARPSSPQPIGAVLDNGFSLFRYSLVHTFAFAFLSVFLSAPINRLVQSQAADPAAGVLVPLVGSVAVMAIAIVFYAPLIATIDAVQKGQSLPMGEAFAHGLQRFPTVVGVALLVVAAVALGMLLLVVPGVFLMVALAFSFIAAIVERKGVVESIRYSWELVRGNWWRTAALLTIISIVVAVLYALIGLVIGLNAVFGEPLDPARPMPWYVDYVVNPLIAGFVAPLSYALFMSVYVDLKLRREGSDIAERIAAAEA